MEDQKKFKEMFLLTCERFDKEPSPMLSKMVWESLKDYNNQSCIDAFRYIFQHSRFFKDIVPDLIERLESETKQISSKSKAEIQVDIVLTKLRNHGRNGVVDFTDPVTLNLMSSRWKYTTWAETVLEADLKWWRKEFIDAYQAYSEQDTLQISGTGNKKLGQIDKRDNIVQVKDIIWDHLADINKTQTTKPKSEHALTIKA